MCHMYVCTYIYNTYIILASVCASYYCALYYALYEYMYVHTYYNIIYKNINIRTYTYIRYIRALLSLLRSLLIVESQEVFQLNGEASVLDSWPCPQPHSCLTCLRAGFNYHHRMIDLNQTGFKFPT